VSGKPRRKVDIKIVSPIICVPSSHASKRALPAIQGEHEYFHEYDASYPENLTKHFSPAQCRNRENARG